MDNRITFGYDREAYVQYGIKIPIKIPISSHPHALITGSSGSGKSMTLLFLIGKLLQSAPDIVLYVCDFKNSDDFAFFEGYVSYYTGENCYLGIMEYYQNFAQIRADRTMQNKKRYLLIFDEYPAFLSYLYLIDKIEKKKRANDVLGAVADILMLGRGISCGIWLSTQRPDATLFSNGSRDNFMVIVALGRMSKEQKGMVFSGQEIPDETFDAGEGMLLADGKEIIAVKYPLIQNISDWKQHILDILMSNGQQ